MIKKEQEKLPSNEDVERFEMLRPILVSMLFEIKEFSKKKQDMQLNELKIKKINQILSKIKNILSHEPTIEFLDLLDEDTLPTNSDAVLILDQYVRCMKLFEDKYYGWDGEVNRWRTKENPVKFFD